MTDEKESRGEWSLTEEAFNKLLAAFSQDRDEAARQYEALRRRLIRFFEWRGVPSAEDRADKAFNRIAKRIDEGEQVDNVVAYAYRVAYLLYLEWLKEPELTAIDPETIDSLRTQQTFEDPEHEPRQLCFDRCLGALSNDNQKIILSYYQEERRAKIERRKNLADQLKITLDALRIRAHRIRKQLEECIASCLRELKPGEM